MPLIRPPAKVPGFGCVLAAFAFGRKAFGTGVFERIMVTLGALTLGLALVVVNFVTAWVLLVPMMGGLVILWALALFHDAGYIGARDG